MLKNTFHFRLLLNWSIYAGVLVFLIWLSMQIGVLMPIYLKDPTKVTYLISLIFVCGTIHCGLRAYYLSVQLNAIIDIHQQKLSWDDSDSLPAEFLRTVIKSLKGQTIDARDKGVPESDKSLITEIFAEEAHSQHEFGWFMTSLLVKLGLLGTVIGFVMMLEPLSGLESFAIEDIQGVLTNMTAGMSLALNTTLLGLIGSMLLSFQYLLLDRGADELVARTVNYMETELIPAMHINSE